MNPAEIKKNETEITSLARAAEKGISASGPKAWLNYFENSPDFYMASDGNLVFKDYPSAQSYITETLEYSIPSVKLKWDNLKVYVLSPDFGSIACGFSEQLTNNEGKIVNVSGYFTATVHKTTSGWKIRNVHWSIKKS